MTPLDDEQQRDLAVSLAAPEVWRSGNARPAPRHFVLDVVAFAERARQEEILASSLCDEILSGPPQWWSQRLRKSGAAAATAGMVKELLERWRVMLSGSPANALQVTSLAIQIANAIEVSEYPCDYVVKLRAQGYRDHAYVLLFMGRHPEALEFVERSRRLYEQAPLPEYELARVGTVKAAILRYLDKFEEALALVRDSAETFLRYGDQTRYVNARMTEAAILYERGHIAEALAVWESIDGDPALDDLGAVGVRNNIANCYADLGQPERAAEYVQPCIAQFELLGMETERTRSRWLLARTLVASGRHKEAIPVLRDTWREFEQFDMISDAGLVALELAEALLIVGTPEEVPAICRDAINQFTRAGMASRAITALSFLREAVAIGQAQPSLVRHVHAFLRELPKEQPRLFAPPPRGAGD